MVLMYFVGKAFGCNGENAIKEEIESGNYYH